MGSSSTPPPTPSPSPPPPPTPPQDKSTSPEKIALEIEQLRAEIEKAKADTAKATIETDYLKRRWYRKSEVLQPLAVIIVTISGTLLLDVNGFFDTKLASLKMQQKESFDQLESLNQKKSALNAEVEALGRERDDLKQKFDQSVSKIERLEDQYKRASTKALQGEGYRRQVAEMQKQLQQTIAQAKAARAAAEAAKWHEGDSIRISVLDAVTKKPVAEYLALLPGKPWNIVGRFNNARIIPRPADNKSTSTDGQITGKWDIHFELLDDRFVYTLSKQDITASSIEITFFAPGYRKELVSVPAGYKALTVYLNPDSTKTDSYR